MFHQRRQIGAAARAGRRGEHQIAGASFDKIILQRRIVLQIDFRTAARDLVERRLGDKQVPAVDQRRHVAEEEGEQQRADVGAVHIGVGHDDDLVIAQFFEVEFRPDTGAQRLDQRTDFTASQHAVEPGALYVQDLAAQGQDGLVLAVAAILGAAAGGIAFDQEQFRFHRITLLAIGQLAGQARHFEHALAPGQVTRLLRGFARGGGINDLGHDGLGVSGVFLQPHVQPIGHQAFQRLAHFR